MKITTKICNTEFVENRRFILSEICWNSVFFDILHSYILISPDISENRRNNIEVFFVNYIALFQSITELFLKMAVECLNKLAINLRMALSVIQINCPVVKTMNDVIIMDKTTKILQQCTNIKSNMEMKSDQKNELQNAKPPEDFRNLSLYPEPLDMKSGKVFLRPNIVKGAYQDFEHYLDVQFRLLREDFISPLREGIKCYKENNKNPRGKRKIINNINIYQNVQFEREKKVVQNKLGYLINFDKNNKLKINWDSSKRFMDRY